MFDAVGTAHAEPFVWGGLDCVGFVARCVEACIGSDAMPAMPTWADEKSARRALKKEGGLAAAIAGRFEEVPVAMAGRGDIGIVEHDGVTSAVVCTGLNWIGKTEAGVIALSQGHVSKAFRV